MNNLAVIPTADVLAQRYTTAFIKLKAGRAQWIEGTLELVVVVAEARKKYPDHREYNRWIARNGLQDMSETDRSALSCFARDLVYTRQLLEQSYSISWQQIWRTRPNRTPSESREGAFSHRSGSSQRKRAARIPTVMQEANPRPERKAAILKSLTKEQVDPDFKGTHLEFVTQYGHVNLHTKEEIEHNKRQEALQARIGTISEHARTGQAMVAALATIDPASLREWMAKPAKAEKLRAWLNSVQLACENLRKIVPEKTGAR